MRRTGNRGQVLLVFLGGLLALLGVAALGIDVGYLYTVRHELQRCTDAGALAGASAFLSGSWTDGATRAVADGRARAFATMDNVAATVLRRAVDTDPGGDDAKVGLLYWLGRSEEEQGHGADALTFYQRVFAVDIRFQDVSERVKSLAKAGR